MFRLARPRLPHTPRCTSSDFVSESLAFFRQLLSESNPAQPWRGLSRGFAKLPGSEPLPSSSRPKRFGTRKGLPAEEQASSEAVSGSDIPADAHAANIATLQRETAKTGIRRLFVLLQNQPSCLQCMAYKSGIIIHHPLGKDCCTTGVHFLLSPGPGDAVNHFVNGTFHSHILAVRWCKDGHYTRHI